MIPVAGLRDHAQKLVHMRSIDAARVARIYIKKSAFEDIDTASSTAMTSASLFLLAEISSSVSFDSVTPAMITSSRVLVA